MAAVVSAVEREAGVEPAPSIMDEVMAAGTAQ
jgi:hypothetical protein